MLSVDCCCSDLALYKNPPNRVGLVQSGPDHDFIENELVLVMIKLKTAELELINNHSLT